MGVQEEDVLLRCLPGLDSARPRRGRSPAESVMAPSVPLPLLSGPPNPCVNNTRKLLLRDIPGIGVDAWTIPEWMDRMGPVGRSCQLLLDGRVLMGGRPLLLLLQRVSAPKGVLTGW